LDISNHHSFANALLHKSALRQSLPACRDNGANISCYLYFAYFPFFVFRG
jgi:hypothetical protein